MSTPTYVLGLTEGDVTSEPVPLPSASRYLICTWPGQNESPVAGHVFIEVGTAGQVPVRCVAQFPVAELRNGRPVGRYFLAGPNDDFVQVRTSGIRGGQISQITLTFSEIEPVSQDELLGVVVPSCPPAPPSLPT